MTAEARRWIWAFVLAGLFIAYQRQEAERKTRLARVGVALNVALEEGEDWRTCVEYALIQLKKMGEG